MPHNKNNDLQPRNFRSVKYPDNFNKVFLMKPIRIHSTTARWF